MKVVIQQNWTSGLGDLYTGACEYLNFIKNLKERGYQTELIFSIHSGLGGSNKYINECQFEDIFDKKTFKYFDKISTRLWAHTEKTLNNLNYNFTVHGCNNPGVHWWDCYSDGLPDDIVVPWYGSDRFLYTDDKPNVLPKFNKIVYTRREKFLGDKKNKFNFIQVRVADMGNQDISKLKPITKSLKKNIKKKEELFLVGGNNEYVTKRLNLLTNVFEYKYKNLKVFPNDHPYYFYHHNLTKDMYLDRIYDNLAEMTSLEFANKIYQYTLFGWTSNFLFYGFTKNKNLRYIKVNNTFEIND